LQVLAYGRQTVPEIGVSWLCELFKFWKIIDISELVQDRHSYKGRLIGNDVWPIKRDDCQWLSVRLKVTFAVLI